MNKEFLKQYLNTDSPSTFEVEAQKVWIEQVSKYSDMVESDNFGNVYAYKKSLNDNIDRYKVVIDAHCDEIGWICEQFNKY